MDRTLILFPWHPVSQASQATLWHREVSFHRRIDDDAPQPTSRSGSFSSARQTDPTILRVAQLAVSATWRWSICHRRAAAISVMTRPYHQLEATHKAILRLAIRRVCRDECRASRTSWLRNVTEILPKIYKASRISRLGEWMTSKQALADVCN